MSDRNVPVRENAADDREMTRLMAGLPGMVYRASAQPPFVFEIVGGGYERIFGRSAADLVGKPEILTQTMHPDDVSRYVETVTAAVNRREPFHLEYRLIQPDGTERSVWEQGRPLAMPDGRVVIEGSIIDIEEPVRARLVQDATYRISQAAASAESLQELYGHIHHIIAELMPSENLYIALRDPTTGFITYPYYIDEYDIVPPDPQMAETGLTAFILRSGIPLLMSECGEAEPVRSGNVTPTGTRPTSWLGVPLRLKGKAIGVIAVQVYRGSYRYTERDRDVLSFVADQIAVAIERRRATVSIRESELRYRSLFEDSPVALWEEDFSELSDRLKQVLPPNTGDVASWLHSHPEVVRELASLVRVVDVNRAALKLTGASQKSELIGSLVSSMPDEALERFELQLVHVAKGDLSFQWEGAASTVDNELLSISMRWMVAPGDEESLRRVLVAMDDITDRVRAEHALQASETRMRALFVAMNDIIIVLDKDSRYIEIAPTRGDLLYRPREELLGRTVRELFDSDLADRFLENIHKALANQSTVDMDYSLAIGQSHLWFEARISPLPDERVLLVAHDATARHDAQEAARIEASKAETYFNTSGVIMEVIDTNLRLVRLNQTGYDFFGYAPEEIVGKDWLDIRLPERERDKIKALIRSELAGQVLPIVTENPVVTRSGEERIVAWHDSLLRDSKGQVSGTISSGVDVTDRVRAEHALQASELKFRELFNQAQDAILLHVINADETMGSIIEANDVACQWSGYTREELQNMTINDVSVNATPEMPETMVRQLREHGKTSFAGELKARDGHHIPVEVSASLFVLGGQSVVLNIARDITERVRLESELQRMDKLESLGILAGGIAHDFNNMMTGIIGNINLARIEDDTDRSHELLEEAEREVLQARGLTQQLLTFAKGGAPVRSVQDVAHILREAVSFALRGSDVSAFFDLPADLWWANVDTGQVSQVFSNIIINADEAMPTGGTISVVARNVAVDGGAYPDLAPGDYVRIDLSDTGVGIAETHLRKIFDPFFSTKRRGSGLGLATSYSIIHKHDGYISVASIPGAGTTFSIFLPATPAHPSHQACETALRFSGQGRALVMDDEFTVRQVVVAMLKKLGYDAEAVPDGASALRADAAASAAGRPFSIIIMDLTIPGGMGGEETVVPLRAQHTTARLIASSGYANDPVMSQYRSYQFDAVLAKPYSFTELTSVLASLADQPSVLSTDV